MDGDQDEMAGPGVLAVPEREWEQARLRAGVIGRLAEHDPAVSYTHLRAHETLR